MLISTVTRSGADLGQTAMRALCQAVRLLHLQPAARIVFDFTLYDEAPPFATGTELRGVFAAPGVLSVYHSRSGYLMAESQPGRLGLASRREGKGPWSYGREARERLLQCGQRVLDAQQQSLIALDFAAVQLAPLVADGVLLRAVLRLNGVLSVHEALTGRHLVSSIPGRLELPAVLPSESAAADSPLPEAKP